MVTPSRINAETGLTDAWHPLKFHVEQAKLWTCDKRFVYVPAGRGSGKCIAHGSLVTLTNGTIKQVQDVVAGDMVASVNARWQLELRAVQHVMNNGVKPTVYVRAGDNTLRCTTNHPILAKRCIDSHPILANTEWIDAGSLQPGDLVATPRKHDDESTIGSLTGDVMWEEVISVTDAGDVNTYDLTVEGNHNFIANGIVTHNTEMAKRRLVRHLPIKKPWSDPRYFYGAPTYAQAKRIAWHHLLRLIPPHWIEPGGIHTSELYIRTVFGSELWVIGLDKPQRVEGNQWDGCVCDEQSDLRPNLFSLSILPALTWRNGWCWRIGVPKRFGIGAHEFKTMYFKACKGEIPDSAGFTWPSKGIVPQAALEQAAASMDVSDYNEQFGAHWEDIGGGVFHNFSEEGNVRPCMYHPDLPIIVCSDFNVDPMAWVLCHRFGNRIEVFDELWIKNTNTPRVLTILWEKYQHHKAGFEFYGDATSKARKTSATASDYAFILNDSRFKYLGRSVHYIQSNPPVADRFAATNALILAGNGLRRLHIDPHCKHMIDDLASRQYKPGTRDLPASEGDIGHISDALGYGIYKMFPIVIEIEGAPEVVVTGQVYNLHGAQAAYSASA